MYKQVWPWSSSFLRNHISFEDRILFLSLSLSLSLSPSFFFVRRRFSFISPIEGSWRGSAGGQPAGGNWRSDRRMCVCVYVRVCACVCVRVCASLVFSPVRGARVVPALFFPPPSPRPRR